GIADPAQHRGGGCAAAGEPASQANPVESPNFSLTCRPNRASLKHCDSVRGAADARREQIRATFSRREPSCRDTGHESGAQLPAGRAAGLAVGGSRPARTRICGNSADPTGRADQPSGITARPPFDQIDWAGTKHQPASLIAKLPNASTSSISPGRSSVVEAYSSINAGPIMRLPATSAGRQNTGVGRKRP